jgi:tetratricopeptide (TPR) repeat protein
MRSRLLGFLAAALCPFVLGAQHHHETAAPAPAAAQFDPGLGAVTYAVSTKNADAQRYFDQGLRYVYAFNHESAVRSFKRAAELDPALAMAHWGTALALGPNINLDVDPASEKAAWEASQEALKRLDGASPKERDLITTLSKRYSVAPDADLKQLARDYSAAMGALAKKYPEDVDIATLYAESMMNLRPWRLWTHAGDPEEGTEEIVRVLEGVLKKAPNHTGANHYYIHTVEASRDPGRALASAKRLESLAPAAGHLVHMPAHVYQRTGNYAAAARANEEGAKADRAYLEQFGGNGVYALMYFNHNLYFGAASHAMRGHYADARRMADEVAKNAGQYVKDMPMLESVTVYPVLMMVRFGKWDEVLAAPDPTAGPMSASMWRFARATALARLGRTDEAAEEQRLFEAARATIAAEDKAVYQNEVRNIAAVGAEVLRGRLAEARGDREAALAAYRRAVEAEDSLTYDEPADWFYPVRETLGAALLRAGKPTEAEAVFRADLTRNPENPRSLHGLATALEKQSKKRDAKAARKRFEKAWKGADATLTLDEF